MIEMRRRCKDGCWWFRIGESPWHATEAQSAHVAMRMIACFYPESPLLIYTHP